MKRTSSLVAATFAGLLSLTVGLPGLPASVAACLLYTSDAADE